MRGPGWEAGAATLAAFGSQGRSLPAGPGGEAVIRTLAAAGDPSAGAARPSACRKASRFVLNQDAGAAIKGAGRVDIFCGTGERAEIIAGSFMERGELFFLRKKRSSALPDSP